MSDDTKEKKRLRRAALKLAGLCMSCWTRPARVGSVICEECSVRSNNRVKERRSIAIANGKCTTCFIRDADTGYKSCHYCRVEMRDPVRDAVRRENHNRYRRRLRASGICTCGKPAKKGTKQCIDCSKAAADYKVKVSAERKALGMCVTCGNFPAVKNRVSCETCLDKHRKSGINSKPRRHIRDYGITTECYMHYGGARCVCCGEDERMFLSLDHINNDGHIDRKNGLHGGARMYQKLKDMGWPEGYQVLCMNCNTGKYRNGGICPHKSK